MKAIRIDELREYFPVTERTIYRYIKDGIIPLPVKVGFGRANVWVKSEIEEIIEIRNSRLPEDEKIKMVKCLVAKFNISSSLSESKIKEN